MDFEQTKAAMGQSHLEEKEWADPFERWMELADLLLRESRQHPAHQ